jgi:hypothetical protein
MTPQLKTSIIGSSDFFSKRGWKMVDDSKIRYSWSNLMIATLAAQATTKT